MRGGSREPPARPGQARAQGRAWPAGRRDPAEGLRGHSGSQRVSAAPEPSPPVLAVASPLDFWRGRESFVPGAVLPKLLLFRVWGREEKPREVLLPSVVSAVPLAAAGVLAVVADGAHVGCRALTRRPGPGRILPSHIRLEGGAAIVTLCSGGTSQHSRSLCSLCCPPSLFISFYLRSEVGVTSLHSPRKPSRSPLKALSKGVGEPPNPRGSRVPASRPAISYSGSAYSKAKRG